MHFEFLGTMAVAPDAVFRISAKSHGEDAFNPTLFRHVREQLLRYTGKQGYNTSASGYTEAYSNRWEQPVQDLMLDARIPTWDMVAVAATQDIRSLYGSPAQALLQNVGDSLARLQSYHIRPQESNEPRFEFHAPTLRDPDLIEPIPWELPSYLLFPVCLFVRPAKVAISLIPRSLLSAAGPSGPPAMHS